MHVVFLFAKHFVVVGVKDTCCEEGVAKLQQGHMKKVTLLLA